MIWGEHMKKISEEESLLYWVLLRLIEPHPGRPLNARLKYLFGPEQGLSGDPGWTIERSDEAEAASYDVVGEIGFHNSPFSNKTYSENAVRSATLRTLQEVAVAYPERESEVLKTIKEFGLDN